MMKNVGRAEMVVLHDFTTTKGYNNNNINSNKQLAAARRGMDGRERSAAGNTHSSQ